MGRLFLAAIVGRAPAIAAGLAIVAWATFTSSAARAEDAGAVVGCGVCLTLDAKGTCTAARLSLGAVAERPLLVAAAAAALIGPTDLPDRGGCRFSFEPHLRTEPPSPARERAQGEGDETIMLYRYA